MKEFWNEKYAQAEYIYGQEPNDFFRQQLDRLPLGKILLPGEGEGRNAVYAASIGWQVTAFDYSESALDKALKLAHERNVKLSYLLSDYHSIDLKEDEFDVIALVYTHTLNWQQIFPNLTRFIKKGGILIVELFNKKQMQNSSGGPKNPEMLPDASELGHVLKHMSSLKIWEEEIILSESRYHEGKANVTRCLAVK